MSAREAEIKALEWDFEIAEAKGWNQMVWSSDALNVVEEVNSNQDSGGWYTRYAILRI